jgi:hypothetical protein
VRCGDWAFQTSGAQRGQSSYTKRGAPQTWSISLLSSLYKLFSGELAARLVKTATGLEWISADQKGFLPGINAIQEHTEVLTAAITRAKKLIEDLSICFLVLANAFGSLPHAVLCSFFDSLLVPYALKRILKDIRETRRNRWSHHSSSK